MSKYLRAVALILVAPVLIWLPSTTAADSGPVVVLRAFFVSVDKRDYATAWSAFSAKSRYVIVRMVADDEKMPVDAVRKLFDTDSTRVQRGFWDHFRAASKPDAILQLAMLPGEIHGNDGSVRIEIRNGKEVKVLMHREHGSWKVEWMETFFPDNKYLPH